MAKVFIFRKMYLTSFIKFLENMSFIGFYCSVLPSIVYLLVGFVNFSFHMCEKYIGLLSFLVIQFFSSFCYVLVSIVFRR